MSEIAVCSMFSNSQKVGNVEINQVDRFFNQCQKIKPSRYFLVEGDSTDRTFSVLGDYKRKYKNIELVKMNLGGVVSSTTDVNRINRLSKLANSILNLAKKEYKIILWVESDFIIPDGSFEKLIDFTSSSNWKNSLGICGVPMHENGPFYDTWAYETLDGERFDCGDIKSLMFGNRYKRMKGFGSCAFLNSESLNKFNIDFGDGCFRYLCNKGIENNLELWCDTECVIYHPNSKNINGRLV